jgi:hypothetical protein
MHKDYPNVYSVVLLLSLYFHWGQTSQWHNLKGRRGRISLAPFRHTWCAPGSRRLPLATPSSSPWKQNKLILYEARSQRRETPLKSLRMDVWNISGATGRIFIISDNGQFYWNVSTFSDMRCDSARLDICGVRLFRLSRGSPEKNSLYRSDLSNPAPLGQGRSRTREFSERREVNIIYCDVYTNC